jgi:hypothetical protein
MTSDAPPVRSLDALRADLRAEGHTDDEISRIIVEWKSRQLSQPQAAATTGAGGVTGGVMSGVLNNLSVAITLATGFLPSLATDIANLLGAHSSLQQRSRAGVFLAAKLALVIVIGFAIYQEWEQHIINATAISTASVTKTEAEAEVAKRLNEAQVKKLQAEADIAKEINEAQLVVAKLNAVKATGALRSAEDVRITIFPSPSIQSIYEKLKALHPDVLDTELKRRAAFVSIATIERNADHAWSDCYQQYEPQLIALGLTKDQAKDIVTRGCNTYMKRPAD